MSNDKINSLHAILTNYDLDLEFSLFDTSNEDHLNKSVDLINTKKYFYKPNTQPQRKLSLKNDYDESKSIESFNKEPLNLYSISSYRTRELSWTVKYMAMINQYNNSNILLVDKNEIKGFENENQKFYDKLCNYIVTTLYTRNLKFERNSIKNVISIILFIFLCSWLIFDILPKESDEINKQHRKSTFRLILFSPPHDFIVCKFLNF